MEFEGPISPLNLHSHELFHNICIDMKCVTGMNQTTYAHFFPHKPVKFLSYMNTDRQIKIESSVLTSILRIKLNLQNLLSLLLMMYIYVVLKMYNSVLC